MEWKWTEGITPFHQSPQLSTLNHVSRIQETSAHHECPKYFSDDVTEKVLQGLHIYPKIDLTFWTFDINRKWMWWDVARMCVRFLGIWKTWMLVKWFHVSILLCNLHSFRNQALGRSCVRIYNFMVQFHYLSSGDYVLLNQCKYENTFRQSHSVSFYYLYLGTECHCLNVFYLYAWCSEWYIVSSYFYGISRFESYECNLRLCHEGSCMRFKYLILTFVERTKQWTISESLHFRVSLLFGL